MSEDGPDSGSVFAGLQCLACNGWFTISNMVPDLSGDWLCTECAKDCPHVCESFDDDGICTDCNRPREQWKPTVIEGGES